MSCVLSKVFKHEKKKTSTDYETEHDFKYSTHQSLKTYGIDDKFHVECEYYSGMMGSVSTSIELSVDEAKRIKNQLEDFISQNN